MAPRMEYRGDYAGAVLAQVNTDGTVGIVVVGTIKVAVLEALKEKELEPNRHDMDVKLPGGCADFPEETPEKTVLREIGTEVFEGEYSIGEARLIHVAPGKNDFEKGGVHTKRFFLSTNWKGELRQVDKVEDEKDEGLAPPEVVEFKQLSQLIFHSHFIPLFKAMLVLAAENKAVAEQYSELFRDYQERKVKVAHKLYA